MKKRFISYIETAQFLGLSRPTIDRLIARGEIPSYKIGKRRLFDPEELIEWVKSHRNGPAEKTIRSIKKPRQRKP
jgi:excisionase family DNA binding protein